jgi:hypothetical protein
MKSFPATLDSTYDRSAQERLVGLWSRFDWRSTLAGVGLWLVFVALFASIQFATPNLPGIDDYFHIRFAQVMRDEGLQPDFIWLPLTILNAEDFYDHHFLYHVLLIPFTYAETLREGAKWAAIIFPATAFLMGWILLRGQRVPYPTLWAFGFFAVSEAFLYRMSMIRVQSVSLFMLLLMLHVTLKKRYRWLLLLAFVYTWLYDAFPLLLTMIGMIVIVRWLFDRQLNLAPLLYTIGGVAAGLIINPYFPNNIYFIYDHILPKIVALGDSDVRVGGEWYAYNTWTLVENSGMALVAFIAGTFALGLNKQRMSTTTAIFFLVALFFGLLLFKSRRFVEYYPAFVLLFCAVAWKPMFEAWIQSKTRMAKILPLVMVLILVPAIGHNIKAERENLTGSTPYQRYADASIWLKTNTPPGSRVFQTDWDDFSRLFHYNTHNTYTLGLDPTYMHRHDAQLYELWRDTTNGWGNIGQAIRHDFGAQYVITDLKHYGFLDKADYDPYLKEVYRDQYAVIFQVLDEPDPDKFWYDANG